MIKITMIMMMVMVMMKIMNLAWMIICQNTKLGAKNMFYQFIHKEFLRGEAPQWLSEARLFASEASKHSAGASKNSARSADFFASGY